MKIDNVEVYGLAESIVASGLPMLGDYDANKFSQLVDGVRDDSEDIVVQRRLSRAVQLASCAGGESHDCYLCGIVVQANLTFPRYLLCEMQRYHFIDIISSTSTMHKLKAHARIYAMMLSDEEKRKFLEEHFDKATDPRFAHEYMMFAGMHLDDIRTLKANLPEGWLLTERITTNYRQLKTIKRQRRNHPLEEWREFCAWIDTLPMARELILPGEEK